MENIKYILVVRLVEHSICGFSKEREELYPFNNIEIIANEIQICPFCGRPVRAFNCNCKDFQTNLVKMQNYYGDGEHKSRLHSSNINFRVVLSKPISDFQVRILEKNEILDLGTDF